MRTSTFIAQTRWLVGAAILVAAMAWSPGHPTAAGISRASPDAGSDVVGQYASLALDALGFPVVAYLDATNADLKLLHCNDPFCIGGDESISVADAAGAVGSDASLVLDASGRPVVSYYDSTNEDLKLLHCNDPNCVGGDESITSPDIVGNVGLYTSLALDAAGNPVVSYQDFTNLDLKILHCNDPDCVGDDETIESPDTLSETGYYTSLRLDELGYPVVSYSFAENYALKLLRCNDANCSGGDDNSVTVDGNPYPGKYSSLALNASGNPIISYAIEPFVKSQVQRVRMAACDSANCAGNVTYSYLSVGDAGDRSSLALDANGHPIVAFHAGSNHDLMLLRCDDDLCDGVGDSLLWLDTAGLVGDYPSLKLDASGVPVVAYYDATNGDVKIFRCSTVACNNKPGPDDSDGDGCTDAQELGTNEQLGGKRNSLNPYDFYDIDGNKVVDLFADIFAVAEAFGLTSDSPGYDASLDRGPAYDVDPWDLRGPDHTIDLFIDIFGVAYQFGHTCE